MPITGHLPCPSLAPLHALSLALCIAFFVRLRQARQLSASRSPQNPTTLAASERVQLSPPATRAATASRRRRASSPSPLHAFEPRAIPRKKKGVVSCPPALAPSST